MAAPYSIPKPSAGQNGRPFSRLRLAAKLPTVESSTAPSVNSAPSAAPLWPAALPNSGQKISATPASPSVPPATKRAVSRVPNSSRAPSPAASGEAE